MEADLPDNIHAQRALVLETTAPVLELGRRKTETGQIWAYACDDRPWGGNDPPMVAYVYAGDRKTERPEAHLSSFAGIRQVDCDSAYAGPCALCGHRFTVAV